MLCQVPYAIWETESTCLPRSLGRPCTFPSHLSPLFQTRSQSQPCSWLLQSVVSGKESVFTCVGSGSGQIADGRDVSSVGEFGVSFCAELTPAGPQKPTKAALMLPFSAGWGTENTVKAHIKKGSWIKITIGRDHSPITVTGKPGLTWGKFNLIY